MLAAIFSFQEQNPLWERQPTKNGKSSIDFNLDSPFEKNRKVRN